jgi:hypothetical protein
MIFSAWCLMLPTFWCQLWTCCLSLWTVSCKGTLSNCDELETILDWMEWRIWRHISTLQLFSLPSWCRHGCWRCNIGGVLSSNDRQLSWSVAGAISVFCDSSRVHIQSRTASKSDCEVGCAHEGTISQGGVCILVSVHVGVNHAMGSFSFSLASSSLMCLWWAFNMFVEE